jgi:hypothetical protein
MPAFDAPDLAWLQAGVLNRSLNIRPEKDFFKTPDLRDLQK